MAETTYRASCHCGRFVYEATLPSPLTVAVCNCTICTRKGYVLAFENKDQPLRIVKGSLDDLTVYGESYHHWFCPVCAAPLLARSSADPTGRFALNVRCFQGPLDVWALEVATNTLRLDGASLGTPYKETPFSGAEPTGGPAPGEPAKTYHGSCHCGAVRLALRCKPLDTLDAGDRRDVVKECNCSICMRLACRWFYPAADQVAVDDPEHQLAHYTFGQHVSRKAFCRRCGVTLTNGPLLLPAGDDAALAALPPVARSAAAVQRRAETAWRMPVNLRVLYGVDLAALPTEYATDGTAMLPPYEEP